MSERALQPGDRAPAFALQAAGGKTVKLSDFRGKRVVLYFYPKDNTPGCTKEACGFRDAGQQLKARNTVVLGVSRDSTDSHDRFADKFHLPFPLLSDPDAAVFPKVRVDGHLDEVLQALSGAAQHPAATAAG